MSEEQMRMIIIMMIIINYPLLRKNSSDLTMPLALVFDSMSAMKQFLRIYPFDTVELTSSSRIEEMCTMLTDPTEDPVFLLATKGSREGDRMTRLLQILVDAAVAGQINDEIVCQMPAALFLKALPQEFERCFFVIHVSAVPDSFDVLKYLPLSEELPIVYRNINKIVCDGEKASLYASMEFCRLHYNKEEKYLEYRKLLEEVDKILECYENRCNVGEIVYDFIRVAFKWRDITKPGFVNLAELKRKDMTYDNKAIPFNDEFVYMPVSVMKQLFQYMSDVYAIDTIRRTLVKEKLLVVNDDDDYTVKISVGSGRRKRFYRLDTQQFEDENGIPFPFVNREGDINE